VACRSQDKDWERDSGVAGEIRCPCARADRPDHHAETSASVPGCGPFGYWSRIVRASVEAMSGSWPRTARLVRQKDHRRFLSQ
jgi:hypothetical protein